MKTKTAGNAHAHGKISRLREAIEQTKTENLHCLHVTLNIGRVTCKLDLKDTSMSRQEKDWLISQGVKDPTIVMFPALQEAGYAVRKQVNNLRRRYTKTSARYWFVLDSDLENFEKDFAETEAKLESAKNAILDDFESYRERYRDRINAWFAAKEDAVRQRFQNERQEACPATKAKDQIERDFLVYLEDSRKKYLAEFPSASEVEENFSLAIDEYIEISSFISDASLAEESAKHRLHRRWEETIFSHLGECLGGATDDINKVVASVLEEITSKAPHEVDTKTAQQKIVKTVDKLQSLVDFGMSLKDILYKVAAEKGDRGELLDFDNAIAAIAGSLKATEAWFDDDRAVLTGQLSAMRKRFAQEIPTEKDKPGTHRLGRFLRL